MASRGRGQSSYRGRGGRGEWVIAQHGSQRLIATEIANTTSSSTGNIQINASDYKQFLEYKKKCEAESSNTATYANIASEEDNDPDDSFSYEKSFSKEEVLLSENKDLKWRDEP